jgi:solute carrier family 25 (mitochondrial dicarboxylate transporter), member 10
MGLFEDWIAAATANAITSAILHPMDVAKTHLQICEITKGIKSAGNTVAAPAASTSRTLTALHAERGLVGLWAPGLKATMLREMSSSGVRAGFYPEMREHMDELIGKDVDAPTLKRVLAAMSTGWLSAILSNPIDVIKVRMISDGARQRYAGIFAAFRDVVQQEGVRALGKGISASVLRGTFISAGELATYDQGKTFLTTYIGGRRDDTYVHIGASLIAGVASTTVAAPFDVLKTRGMNSTESIGPRQILVDAVRKEGLGVLMRGWVPAYCRLGPHAMICFPIMEKVRSVLGLGAI